MHSSSVCLTFSFLILVFLYLCFSSMSTGLPWSDTWDLRLHGRLFKLDKCFGWQKEESQSLLGGVLSQACWRNVQGSQLFAVVILTLCSQTTTRLAWLQKYLSTKDIFQTPLWGTWLTKGPLGQSCQQKRTLSSLPEVTDNSLPRPLGDSSESQVAKHAWFPRLLRTVGARANVGCQGGHWCNPELHGYEAR